MHYYDWKRKSFYRWSSLQKNREILCLSLSLSLDLSLYCCECVMAEVQELEEYEDLRDLQDEPWEERTLNLLQDSKIDKGLTFSLSLFLDPPYLDPNSVYKVLSFMFFCFFFDS